MPFVTSPKGLLRNKFNLRGKRFVLWKWEIVMKLKKTQINGKIPSVLGFQVLILLQCPFYPEWPTDSMQLISKSLWHFSQS